ncbi:MAG: putative SAM-dependent methyltransferase [Verrucomicrobiales bacterium]|nr:putative SAM-dependent methyltransferase [Verrucomicrobiales bacterium]
MENLPTVIIKPGDANRVLGGHPWIYSGSVVRITAPAEDGALVQIKDHRQRFLGTGLYNSKSKILVRVLSPERVTLNVDFFEQRIREALAVRTRFMPGATSFRVVNAESDFLSGLIVDKYEDALVIQTSALGMETRKPLILEALQKIFSPKIIMERNDSGFRKFEGMQDSNGVLFGQLDGPVNISLNGIKFQVDLVKGHKTGMYLDQQVNYEKVAKLVRGGNVLDCFTFLGGFALHAARTGKAKVHALDQSEEAIKASQENARKNNLAGSCTFETTNVFDWLKARTAVQPHERVIPQFEMIILDPPSFTKNRASVGDAMRGYKEIHLRAFKLLKPGGTLATFCCSHHVDANLFQEVILEAAFDARRVIRKIETYSQSPDHPVIPSIAETEYLKGYSYEMAR